MEFLPNTHGGYLVWWIFVICLMAIPWCPQLYADVEGVFCKDLFNGIPKEITPFISRQESVIGLLMTITRLAGVYDIRNPVTYWATFASFCVQFGNLGAEAAIWGTIKPPRQWNQTHFLNVSIVGAYLHL